MFLSDSQLRCLEQLAEKGHTSCFNCGSQRVGVNEYEARWLLGEFQVFLECPDCGTEAAAKFSISTEEARGCGIDPNANLPRNVP